jgi:hypothetical protein
MESSAPTQEFQPASAPAPADIATAGAHPSIFASIRDQCSACAAAMAPDQRYCVECGQRRGPARVPVIDGLAQRAREAPAARRPPRRLRVPIDSTLIAGIGTLLLAMGIGVLIGRSGNSTAAKSPRVQVVTVPGAGGAVSSGAATSATATPPAAGSGAAATKSGGTHSAASATPTSKKPAAAPPKTVTVGSPGHGPGYQNGHFTGNFFGP